MMLASFRARVTMFRAVAEFVVDERRAVARAVKALGLTAVMFESEALPYPPRDLYRAYVAQSDVFIGLYWQLYGRAGPGMAISGLEDEFELARGLPRLLYVKLSAPDRDPRLASLIARVEDEASDSYRIFRTTSDPRMGASPACATPTTGPGTRRRGPGHGRRHRHPR